MGDTIVPNVIQCQTYVSVVVHFNGTSIPTNRAPSPYHISKELGLLRCGWLNTQWQFGLTHLIKFKRLIVRVCVRRSLSSLLCFLTILNVYLRLACKSSIGVVHPTLHNLHCGGAASFAQAVGNVFKARRFGCQCDSYIRFTYWCKLTDSRCSPTQGSAEDTGSPDLIDALNKRCIAVCCSIFKFNLNGLIESFFKCFVSKTAYRGTNKVFVRATYGGR